MIYIVIALVLVLVIYFVSTYNKLVVLRNKVKDGWAQIDVLLKRRFDLIPNLVETVKGYSKHESETFEKVINARNRYNSATDINDKIKSNNEISECLTHLFALQESYPELKANTNFLDLQSNLKETEDKIQYSRQFYNDSVLNYNNKIEMFPSNIVASIFGFKTMTFFEVDEESRKNPNVKF